MNPTKIFTAEKKIEDQDWEGSLELVESLIKEGETSARVHEIKGLALFNMGHVEQAIDSLVNACSKNRKNTHTYLNLGIAYSSINNFQEALKAIKKGERISPNYLPLIFQRAIILAKMGNHEESLRILKRLEILDPQDTQIKENIGALYLNLGDYHSAETYLLRAIKSKDASFNAHLNLGVVCHRLQNYNSAHDIYEKLLRIESGNLSLILNMASLLIDTGKFTQAETLCSQAIDIGLLAPEIYRFMGAALGQQGRHKKSLEAYERAYSLSPNDIDNIMSLSMGLAESGQLFEALSLIRKGSNHLSKQRKDWNLSLIYLSYGIFSLGWDSYRSRPIYYQKSKNREYRQELSREQLSREITVHAEQGLGDQLLFLRFVPRLIALGANVTKITCGTKVLSLLRRIDFGEGVQVVDSNFSNESEINILCGDLPRVTGSADRSDLPEPNNFVTENLSIKNYEICNRLFLEEIPASLKIPVNHEFLNSIRLRLSNSGPPPYFGVTWRAGTRVVDQKQDWQFSKEVSIPSLATALSKLPGTFLILQRDPQISEINEFKKYTSNRGSDFSDLNEDLESMLALLSLIDEYVAVSNTNVHLRSAVGLPSRVLVPQPPEWRWMIDGKFSPWFPTCRIYRQDIFGQWNKALEALVNDLMSIYDFDKK